jgi:cation/acetate symporter
MVHTMPGLGGSSAAQWFQIAPISAGVFGVPAALAATIVVSLMTPPPGTRSAALVDYIREP